MNEDDKKTETKKAPGGAVEVKEEDLDQASGGAAFVKMPTDQYVENPTTTPLKDPSLLPKDPSLNFAPTQSGEAGIIGEKG